MSKINLQLYDDGTIYVIPYNIKNNADRMTIWKDKPLHIKIDDRYFTEVSKIRYTDFAYALSKCFSILDYYEVDFIKLDINPYAPIGFIFQVNGDKLSKDKESLSLDKISIFVHMLIGTIKRALRSDK